MNYHILQSAQHQDEVQVVFHISVPDEVNGVGTNLRTALSQYQSFTQSAVPWILPADAEWTQIKTDNYMSITRQSDIIEV